MTRALSVFLLCLVWPLATWADIAVIVNPDNPVRAMEPRTVSDLYLGRVRTFGSGEPATVYEQPMDSSLRASFFRALNGMRLEQVNAYWARLRFSGDVLPPLALADSRTVVEAVSNNRSAIGYIDSAAVDGSVRVVLRLGGYPR